jgi:hypothetical protein
MPTFRKVLFALASLACTLAGASAAQAAPTIGNELTLPTGAEAITFDGTNYFLVYETYDTTTQVSTVWGTRVDTSGKVLDPNGITIATVPDNGSGTGPAAKVAYDATSKQYLVAWSDSRNFNNGNLLEDVYGTRVSSAGTVLDPMGIQIGSLPGTQQIESVTAGQG